MSDERRLENKLARLAEPAAAPGPGRALSLAGPGGALRAVLAEIDETVLPRRLHFAAGGAVRLSVEVAERRILAAALAGGAPLPLPESAGNAEPLRAALAEALADAGALAVHPERIPRPEDSGPGLSPRALAAAWGLALDPLPEDPVARLRALRDAAAPWALAAPPERFGALAALWHSLLAPPPA